MKGLTKLTKGDKILTWGMMVSVIILVIEIISTLLSYTSLPPVMPLFNQMPWGEERLGLRIEIGIPLFITFIFLLFNFILSNRLYEKMPLISRMLSVTTLLISLLSVIYVVRTLQLLV